MLKIILTKSLPFDWQRNLFWFGVLVGLFLIFLPGNVFTLVIEYVARNAGNYWFYIALLSVILFVWFMQKVQSQSVYDWARYYGFNITSVESIDIFDAEFFFYRLYRTEYFVTVSNELGENGKLYFWFFWQSVQNPRTRWVSNPIESTKRGEVPKDCRQP